MIHYLNTSLVLLPLNGKTDTVLSDVSYGDSYLRYNNFMRPALKSAVRDLSPAHGSHGLDAGCGPGGVLPLLDAAMDGTGSIIAIDASHPHLNIAREQAQSHGIESRVKFLPARIDEPLPFGDDTFDWVWCADVLWPHRFDEPASILRELARVTRRGGVIGLFFGNFYRSTFFPGKAYLEHRLQRASASKWYGSDAGGSAQERAGDWCVAAGLELQQRSTHMVEYSAPLDPEIRAYLAEYLVIEYGSVTRAEAMSIGVDEETWQEWTQLVDPSSSRYVLDDPGYHCIHSGTLTLARVP